MTIYVFTGSLLTAVIDRYISVIWTTRYFSDGDFELTLSPDTELLKKLEIGSFLVRDKDIETSTRFKNVMRIENIEIKTDAENGNTLVLTGKSLSSIVSQRVVASQTSLRGQLREVIHLLLVENFILPKNTSRQIADFKYEFDTSLTTTIDTQVTGDNLGEWLSMLAEKYGFGWDVYWDNAYIFYLYNGTNRSRTQSAVPWVVFSPDFQNLLNTDYQYLTEQFKNVAVVAGEGEGAARSKVIVGNGTGINRFEQWVDARDISSNDGTISGADYIALLQARGTEALTEHINNELFDGDVDATRQYILNRDFFLGDIVQLENDYGISAQARVLEVIESEDASGTRVIPTFSAMGVM